MAELVAEMIQRDIAFAHEPYDWASRKQWADIPFPKEEYEERLCKVRRRMEEEELDCLLIYASSSRKKGAEWISGFLPIGGEVIIAIPLKGELMMTTNGVYHCAPMHSFFHKTWIRDARPAHLPGSVENPVTVADHVVAYLGDTGLLSRRIGVEGMEAMPYGLWSGLQERLCGTKLLPASITPALRAVKSPREIAILEVAGEATGKGLLAAYEAARAGCRECDLAGEAYRAMAYAADYFTHMMVSSGKNCGLKHLYPSTRALERGDMVYVDLGVSYRGYVTDATRTFCIGPAGEQERKLLDCGLAMYEAVVEAAKPGVAVCQLQDLALEVTMQGKGCGVIEDIILITENGCRALTEAPRKLW